MLIAKELLRLVNDEEGLTTVEYAVAGALVAAAVVGAFSNLGTSVTNRVNDLCTTVASGATTTTNCK
ncbi:Flp family type IVb pilin [Oceanimonas marisflavi]|uniref:Flp family type IVb pilin n=1 Tax=Oceanimonas marisflavi TaxID=2059724 RepID=UPI000D2FE436|nr:Flp family type IVb pilin [Oceanimonas marisflavi]